MHYLDQTGNYYIGERAPGGISVNAKPSKNYKLKANWKTSTPNVWEHDISIPRAEKIKAIDEKTSSLIAQGFTFDGHQFSLSIAAQQNISTLQMLVDKELLDPQSPLSTIDDQVYMLQRADAPAFIQAAYARVFPTKIAGTMLKAQVMTAETEEAINAITDSRT
jgi:hypothetical protein